MRELCHSFVDIKIHSFFSKLHNRHLSHVGKSNLIYSERGPTAVQSGPSRGQEEVLTYQCLRKNLYNICSNVRVSSKLIKGPKLNGVLAVLKRF